MRRVCQWGRPSVGKAERRGETPFTSLCRPGTRGLLRAPQGTLVPYACSLTRSSVVEWVWEADPQLEVPKAHRRPLNIAEKKYIICPIQ